MDEDSQLPIALRRTRRTTRAWCDRDSSPAPESAPAITPRKSGTRKRVRFSDPGPASASGRDGLSATGLTPMVQRTRLSLPSATSPRQSSQTRLLHASNGSGIPDLDHTGSPFGGEVRFLPLRQVLDGRVKRRIRRNGLSEEMNACYAERRRRSRETQAEIQRLKSELARKDDEIQRLHDETVVLDTDRVWELEQQIEALKKELVQRSGAPQAPSSSTSPTHEWTRAARDPFSDDFMELGTEDDSDNEHFGETTVAELMCSTPTRRMRNSFPTPPTTSPAPEEIPTPCRPQAPPASPLSHVGTQAFLPDPEKQKLEEELASLQLEVCKLTSTLESYSALATRLSEKLAPFTPAPSPDLKGGSSAGPPDLEAHLSSVLQTLSDRTAALAELNTSLSSLGFPGSDAFEIIDSLRTCLRTARLELEYLTPGEITLPLTSAGAEVLDLLLTRLRNLAKRNREADESIDEYHALELSLRAQLGARVDAMDALAERLAAAEAASRAKDSRVAELEVGLDRLRGAARLYARDLAELEALVGRMEAELASSSAANEALRSEHARATTQLVADKTAAVAALEAELAEALDRAAALEAELGSLQAAHAEALAAHRAELAGAEETHRRDLAQRDALVAELRGEVERVNAALRAARETAGGLARENGRLARRAEAEGRTAREVVDRMRTELEKVVRMGQGFLQAAAASATTAAAAESEADVGGSGPVPANDARAGVLLSAGDAESDGGRKKKRKYDSGLGFLDAEEAETDG